MVEELLVMPESFRREAGWELLAKFDAEQFPVEAAFWFYYPDKERWVFYVATPRYQAQGGIKTYLDIRAILDMLPDEAREGLHLSDISAVDPDFPLVVVLRRKYGKVSSDRGQRLRRMGDRSDEPYIYRL